jgi:hypothetical protein
MFGGAEEWAGLLVPCPGRGDVARFLRAAALVEHELHDSTFRSDVKIQVSPGV